MFNNAYLAVSNKMHIMTLLPRVNVAIHSLYDFARKQESQLNSSILVTVWRVSIKKGVLFFTSFRTSGHLKICWILNLELTIYVNIDRHHGYNDYND